MPFPIASVLSSRYSLTKWNVLQEMLAAKLESNSAALANAGNDYGTALIIPQCVLTILSSRNV
jgi:hypothetical protein